MLGMKYVVYDDDSFTIFPPNVEHSSMRFMGKTPVSAGFLKFLSLERGAPKVEC